MKNDIELVLAALSGGPEMFSPIIRRYKDAVFAVALARLCNFHDAEDITQEVFIEAFDHLDRLDDPLKLGAWLRSITIHRCIDYLRRRQEVVDLGDIAERMEDSSDPQSTSRQVLCRILRTCETRSPQKVDDATRNRGVSDDTQPENDEKRRFLSLVAEDSLSEKSARPTPAECQ